MFLCTENLKFVSSERPTVSYFAVEKKRGEEREEWLGLQ